MRTALKYALGPNPVSGQKAPQSLVRARPRSPEPLLAVAPRPTLSLPKIWFRGPLDKALKKLIRPATATTRRKEIVIKMNMPRDIFEDMMSNLSEGDAEGLKYDP